MGKTVPAYRWALEDEIASWNGFRKALASDKDREAFDEMVDMYRTFATESSNATNSVIFEPKVMSIFLGQQERLSRIEHKLQNLFWL